MDLLDRLGAPPTNVPTGCLAEAGPAINLTDLVSHRLPAHLRDLCNLVCEALGQALHFVQGSYQDQGITPRPIWAFWAPLTSLEGELASVCILIHHYASSPDAKPGADAATETGAGDDKDKEKAKTGFRYQLCFHDALLHADLAGCLLYSGTHRDPRGREIALPKPVEEDGAGTVLRFTLAVPPVEHTPGLYPAYQLIPSSCSV